MNEIIEFLYDAQKDLKRFPPASPARNAILQNLREQVPAPILAHFLRLIERGKPGVTVVRHGVCTGCHLRVASGIAAALANPKDLHLCDNCGTYLMLAPEEMATVHESRRSHAHAFSAA